ncbi:MAG: hypothetical protein E7Z72_00935 [Methanocorpusculum parvum]|nr:hypothetical protein [Methanocorpusculum parvum]
MNGKKDLSKKDDAVSPVIALMLILAILATCLAVYTATYVPGLKQQDEITHSGEVKLAFERFASDIDNVIALGKPAVYTEVLELGGGDVPLSPTKSSGTIEIETKEIGKYQIDEGAETVLNGIEVRYTPSFTAWEKQGYLYKNGVVWITKDEKKTPAMLTLYDVEDGEDREKEILAKWYPESPTENVIIPNFSVVEKKSEITGTSAVKLRLNATLGDIISGTMTVNLDDTTRTYTNARLLNIEVSVE